MCMVFAIGQMGRRGGFHLHPVEHEARLGSALGKRKRLRKKGILVGSPAGLGLKTQGKARGRSRGTARGLPHWNHTCIRLGDSAKP